MKHPRFSKNKRSFTLIEQVVALAITAILAVVAIPAVNNIDGSMKVGRAAELVANHLHYAQQLAITTGKEHGIAFDTTLEQYQVYREDGGEVVVDDPYQPGQLIIDLTQEPFSNVDIEDAGTTFTDTFVSSTKIIFGTLYGTPKVDNDGTNPAITSGTIVLSKGGITRTVTVEPVTGKVTIQ